MRMCVCACIYIYIYILGGIYLVDNIIEIPFNITTELKRANLSKASEVLSVTGLSSVYDCRPNTTYFIPSDHAWNTYFSQLNASIRTIANGPASAGIHTRYDTIHSPLAYRP